MIALKYWAKSIVMEVFVASLFVAWKWYGIDGAGNVFLFLMWSAVVIRWAAGFFANKSTYKTKRPAGFWVYRAISDFVLIAVMAWHGMFVLAGFYAVAHVLVEVSREREPKELSDSKSD